MLGLIIQVIIHFIIFLTQTTEGIIADTDQIAAENLVYLSQDVVSYTESAELAEDPNVECVTEEVVTDDWVISGGQERYNSRIVNKLLIIIACATIISMMI